MATSARATLFALWAAAGLLAGCFGQNVAEGRYVEAESSGRLQEFADPDRPPGLPVETIHLMRLSIVSFDEEAGGIVEFFESRSHESFSREPSLVTERSPGYFCTRLEQATTRDDVLVFRFTDWLNRSWQVLGEVVEGGDLLEARFERLTAAGEVVERSPETLRYLLDEDELYFREGGDARTQLVLERLDDAVGDDALQCIDYALQDELVLELPFDGSLVAPDEGQLRVALVLTRAATRPTPEAPLAGLNHREVLTASLDLDVDVLDGERRLLVRLPPEERYMVDLGEGIALGTIVVYVDRPEDGEPPDDTWDAIAYSRDVAEEVVAYAPNHVVVFNRDDSEVSKQAKDATGARVEVPLFSDGRVAGWSAYTFTAAGDTLELPDGRQVRLVHQLDARDATIELWSVSEACQLCYPVPQGAPAEPDVCATCAPILPLLYL